MRFIATLAACLALDTAAASITTDFSDLWYDPDEEGWGVTLTQQNDIIFVTLYVYGPDFGLLASTHPFLAPGVTDPAANDARGPSASTSPQRLVLTAPAPGRHYVAVSRAKVGGVGTGSFGAFVLALDEAR